MITSTIEPYMHDVTSLLYLPTGLRFRFRYRHKYIPEEFLNGEKQKALEKQPGLIILRNVETNEFIPIRRVFIDKVENLGGFLLFSFEVGSLVLYDREKLPKSEDQKNQYQDVMMSYIPEKYRLMFLSGSRDIKLVFKVPNQINQQIAIDKEEDPQTSVAIWSNIVENLGRLKAYSKTCFLRITDVIDSKDNSKLQPGKIGTDQRGYKLEAGKTYFVEILQYFPYGIDEREKLTPFVIKLLTDKDILAPIKEINPIVGKYDKLRLIFHCMRPKTSITSFFQFCPEKIKEVDEAGELKPIYDVPTIFAPIDIKVSRKRRYTLFVFSIIGMILVGISSLLPPFWTALSSILGAILSISSLSFLFE